MDLDASTPSQALSKTIRACKRISSLCMAAFVVIVLWIMFVFVLMFLSITNPSTNQEVGLEALPMLMIYALYGINFSFIPLILGRMFKDISADGTPFTKKNSNRLRLLALILVIYSLLELLLALANSQYVLMIPLGELAIGSFDHDFASDAGTTLDVFPLVIAAVFFALSYVFKYGVLLQQESDETL